MIKLYTTTQLIWLPSFEWGDIERVESTVQLKRSMDNITKVTHVHRVPNSKTLELHLTLTRYKSLELLEYFKIHGAEKMTLEVPGSDNRVGYLKINPFELEKVSRSVVSDSKEEVTCSISFETVTE